MTEDMNAFDLYLQQMSEAEADQGVDRLKLLDRIINGSTTETLNSAKFTPGELMNIIDDLLIFLNFMDVLNRHVGEEGETTVLLYASGIFVPPVEQETVA